MSIPKHLRWPLGVILFLVLFVVGLYFYINWSGARTWKEAKAEYEEAGGSFNIDDLLPAPIPDEENYAAIPALRGITIPIDKSHPSGLSGEPVRGALMVGLAAVGAEGDAPPKEGIPSGGYETGVPIDLAAWSLYVAGDRTEDATKSADGAAILSALDAKLGAVFEESDAAISRPKAQFVPPPGEFFDRKFPANTTFAHGSAAIDLGRALSLRAVSATHAGDLKMAADSIVAVFRLSDAELPAFSLIQFLISTAQQKAAFGALWEALVVRAFEEEALTRLQAEFASLNAVASLVDGLGGEIIYSADTIGALHGDTALADMDLGFFPPGWLDDNRALIVREIYWSAIAPLKNRDFAAFKAAETESEERIKKLFTGILKIRWALAGIMLPVYGKMGEGAAHSQAVAHQAEIACALERHFLKHGNYPKTLAALVPEFLKAVPEDPIDKKPTRYRLTPNGRYELWSIGWNFTDDGGTRAFSSLDASRIDHSAGDWVWGYP